MKCALEMVATDSLMLLALRHKLFFTKILDHATLTTQAAVSVASIVGSSFLCVQEEDADVNEPTNEEGAERQRASERASE